MHVEGGRTCNGEYSCIVVLRITTPFQFSSLRWNGRDKLAGHERQGGLDGGGGAPKEEEDMFACRCTRRRHHLSCIFA